MSELEDAIAAQRAQEAANQTAQTERQTEQARRDQQLCSEFVALMRRHGVPAKAFYRKDESKSSTWGKRKAYYVYLGECWIYGEDSEAYSAVSTDGRPVLVTEIYQAHDLKNVFDRGKGRYTGWYTAGVTADELARGARRLTEGGR